MEDEKIIELLFQRSEKGLYEIQQQYGKLCFKIIHNLLQDTEDTKECINDVYLGVWNAIPPEVPRSLKAYICRIARNIALKQIEYHTAQKRNGSSIPLVDEFENCISVMETDYEMIELTEILNGFLEGLDKESRIMFVKRYWFGESLDTLSEMFGESRTSIAVRLSRIKKKLMKSLKEQKITK